MAFKHKTERACEMNKTEKLVAANEMLWIAKASLQRIVNTSYGALDDNMKIELERASTNIEALSRLVGNAIEGGAAK